MEISLEFGDIELQLLIADNGQGFDLDTVGHAREHGGGFGLTSMQQRASLVGGHLDVRSTPGQGAEVHASVPAFGPGERPRPAPSVNATSPLNAVPDEGASGELIRVLIVDDQEIVRSGLSEMLEHEPGLRVVGEAGDGEAALHEIERAAPDVVLLDMQTPGLDGVGTLQRMHEEGTQIPVLLLSVLVEQEQILAGLRAGARAPRPPSASSRGHRARRRGTRARRRSG